MSLIGITDAEERVRAAGLKFEPIGLADYPAGCTRQLFNRQGELLPALHRHAAAGGALHPARQGG